MGAAAVVVGTAEVTAEGTAEGTTEEAAVLEAAVGEVISAERKLHVCKDLPDVGQSIFQGGL